MNWLSIFAGRTRWFALPLCFALTTPLFAADPSAERGKELFQREWQYEAPPKMEQGVLSRDVFVQQLRSLPGDGLGPMFNANSCEACHAAGGASGVDRNVTLITIDPRSPFIKRTQGDQLKQDKQALLELYPGFISPLGQLSLDVVVHEKSSRPLFELVRGRISDFVPGGIPDEWYKSESRQSEAIANRPVLAGRKGDIDFYLSQRNSPPLFGLGLIDRVGLSEMVKVARFQKRQSHGKVTGRIGLGKFGWRAQTATLDQFVRGACAGEVGLQLATTPQPTDVADETYVSLGIDLSEPQVKQLVSFVRALPPPIKETKIAEEAVDVREGEQLFAKIGCAACHVQNMIPAKGIYSDLLLHDMGSLLQAPSPAPPAAPVGIQFVRLPTYRPETPSLSRGLSVSGYYGLQSAGAPVPFAFARPAEPTFPYGKLPAKLNDPVHPAVITWDSLQREWRTPPLWGVADSGPYLHDGRAETLDAAIRWHGGEAADPARNYRSLPEYARKQVVAFLRSLRSPPSEDSALPETFGHGQQFSKPKPVAEPATSAEPDPGSLEEALKVFQVRL